MADFTDQVVIVTGGAKGIGAGISRAFAGEGAKVAALDIDAEAGAALAKEEGLIRFFAADVANDEVCAQTVGQILDDWIRRPQKSGLGPLLWPMPRPRPRLCPTPRPWPPRRRTPAKSPRRCPWRRRLRLLLGP